VPYVQILIQTPQGYQVQGVGTNSFKSSTACVNWINVCHVVVVVVLRSTVVVVTVMN